MRDDHNLLNSQDGYQNVDKGPLEGLKGYNKTVRLSFNRGQRRGHVPCGERTHGAIVTCSATALNVSSK